MSTLRTIRSAAAPAAKTLLMKGGVYAALRRLRPSHQLAILRYHAICEPDGTYADPTICVSPADFEQHVRYLASNYSVLALPRAAAALVAGSPLPPNAVAITFDDGYADNLDAARVLHRHGLTATFYITAGCLSDGQPFWPAELRELVAAAPGPSLTLTMAAGSLDLPLCTPEERKAAVSRLTRTFKSHPIPVRERLRDQLRALAGPRLAARRVMLTWDEVREMHRLGMTIGAHTMTHPNLPSAGLQDATAEIVGCKGRLEQEIDAEVTMFSYPNGGAERYYTPDLQRVVREAGFEAASTSRNGFAGHGSDAFALERVQVAQRVEDLVFALEVERFAMRPAPKARGLTPSPDSVASGGGRG